MIKRSATVLLLLLLVVPAGFVVAQASASSGEEFCATAPQDLLAALDGSWTLTQGPGLAIGGLPIPLPGHPPVAVGLEYISEAGFAIMTAQGQDLIMWPEATENASNLLGDLNQYLVTSTEGMDACDWDALPTLVGTNLYALSFNLVRRSPTMRTVAFGFCRHGERWEYYFDGLTIDVEQTVQQCSGCFVPCNIPIGNVPAGMTMTVALKFDSPSSARGMLSFEGKSGPFPFAAWAPITMAR